MLKFNEDGLLPPEDYAMTFTQLRNSILVQGPCGQDDLNWDTRWRSKLVDNLEIMVTQLWEVNNHLFGSNQIGKIFIDGSFTEMKAHPNDIDGYFECELNFLASGALTQELNRLDPYKIWTWNHRARTHCPGSTKKQLPMWHRYHVELYPHFPGLLSGIQDEYGNDQAFPAAFRKTRDTFRPKGIIQIIRQ